MSKKNDYIIGKPFKVEFKEPYYPYANNVTQIRRSHKYSNSGCMPELPDYTFDEFSVDIKSLPDSWDAKKMLKMFQEQGIMFVRNELDTKRIGSYPRKMLLLL